MFNIFRDLLCNNKFDEQIRYLDFNLSPFLEVNIHSLFLYSLDKFFDFTSDLVSFYKNNDITPVIESDFSSSEKLDSVYSFFRN